MWSPNIFRVQNSHQFSNSSMAFRLLPFVASLIASHALAATPCDFKGVSVGDKTTPPTLMNALGIKEYKMNPVRPDSDTHFELVKRFGAIAAGEIQDWNIGPACDAISCRIPFGISMGNGNSIPVSVYLSFPEGVITEIDITFSQAYWDELRPITDMKYGEAWSTERDPSLLITDLDNEKTFIVELLHLTHQINGTNPKTLDTCQIWMTNYDSVFTHHDPLGAFHSILVIKLISRNL